MSIPDSGTAESMYFRKKHFTFSEKCDIIIPAMCFPPLAQLDRVSDSDSEGHRFESCRAGHNAETKKKSPAKSPNISGFFATQTAIFHCAKTQMQNRRFPFADRLEPTQLNTPSYYACRAHQKSVAHAKKRVLR